MKTLGVATLLALLGLSLGAAVSSNITCDWNECSVPCGGGERICDRSNGKTWNIACHVQDCADPTADEKCGKADLVFVIDASTSIGEKNWWKTKQFLIDVSKGLVIGEDESRVAVVIYSNQAEIVFMLDAYNNIDDLEKAIWEIDYLTGNTNTYEGLLNAEDVINQQARNTVKHMVIVVTDGKANNKASLLPGQVDVMHQRGIEIFALGVGADVDKDEINMIASNPKADHAYEVADYDALDSITNTIISDTCESAGMVECSPWSDWTACIPKTPDVACGEGYQTRAMICEFKFKGSDDVTETRVVTEKRDCENVCDRCAKCENFKEGIGYAVHENCHKFYMCEYVAGRFIEHEKVCPPNLFWRQSALTCDRIRDFSYQCLDTPVEIITTSTTPAPCEFEVDPDSPYHYLEVVHGRQLSRPCPPGTRFNLDVCRCVLGGPVEQCDNLGTILFFPFNDDLDDVCNRAVGLNNGNVSLVDGAAYFDGSSRVEIPYLKNFFADNEINSLTLSMWFKYTGSDTDKRGLFSNGDCKDDASLLLAIQDDHTKGQVRVTVDDVVSFSEEVNKKSVSDGDWIFATVVYSGQDVRLYINGAQVTTWLGANGFIANTQCPATVGFDGSGDERFFFQGYIDDVRLYQKTFYDFDVQTLYNNGRQ